MRYTVSILALALLGGLFYDPKLAVAQNKDILQVQRELYDVGKAITDLKESGGANTAQIQAQLKQVLDANAKLASQVAELQQKLAAHQTDQQKLVIEPIAATKKAVDDQWSSVSAVESKINAMRTKQDKMDESLQNLSGQLGLMRTDMSKAAQPASNPADAAALAFAAAQRDRLVGNLSPALAEFQEISTKFASSPEAPMSLFQIGMIYNEVGQYKDSLEAFDRVLEQFGDNPMRKQAQFQKAAQLANLGRNTEAAREYDSFARQYSGDDNAPIALQRAKELRGPAASKGKQPAKARGKN